MLVLTRKEGEEVVIGTTIRLRVVAVNGNRVRLGVTAPPEMPIRREERARPPDCPNGLDPGSQAASPTATAERGRSRD
jgi:carbon storage regulator